MFLPGATEPVVAGVVAPARTSAGLTFQYGDSYLARPDAIALGPHLALGTDVHSAHPVWGMPLTIRDAMPDSWGQKVIQHTLGVDSETRVPDIRMMLASGSDRVGALDFQAESHTYVPRIGQASLEILADGAARVQDDEDLTGELRQAVRNSMATPGGAQPKAFVHAGGRQWLAKFTVRTDTEPLIKAEAAAIILAGEVGITVPRHQLITMGAHGDILLTERFDRTSDGGRRQVVSGYTVAESTDRVGSYPELVDRMRQRAAEPTLVGPEIFRRLAFLMVVRADDDHLRNTSAFWDGHALSFTPAYDLSPFMGAGTSMTQTRIGTDGDRRFNLGALLTHRASYGLSEPEASEIMNSVISAVDDGRHDAAEQARMTSTERRLFFGALLRPEIMEGLPQTIVIGRAAGSDPGEAVVRHQIAPQPSYTGRCGKPRGGGKGPCRRRVGLDGCPYHG
ncbi:HipA domain-containing protein [Cryobacterium sp. 10S3]|uniref:type II toxin-antitoxin system HipA family toxin n=1 Tax=Cryobacterium sp. RTC2.1 TaxID=3048634 RepID=UPI002B3E4C2F|nr:HipA domain-containing protein [Cryobacterium sp. RTC2.1]MEB0286686.1 HipA domain-containing protein [Cryobacterium sp. 10S3]